MQGHAIPGFWGVAMLIFSTKERITRHGTETPESLTPWETHKDLGLCEKKRNLLSKHPDEEWNTATRR